MLKRNAPKKQMVLFLGITILGVLLRIIWIAKIPNQPMSDFLRYYKFACQIYKGYSAWDTTIGLQGMAYPVALGQFFKIVGTDSVFAGKIFNLILSIFTLIIFYFIINKLTDKISLILITYTALALLPNYIVYNSVLGTEIFVTFFFAVIVLLQVSNFNNKIRYILLGCCVTVAALTKPYFIAYPLILTIIQWLKNKNAKETITLFLSVTLLMVIIIAPWTYRNYVKFNTFIPISYNGGYVLYINNNDMNFFGGWMRLGDVPVSQQFKEKIVRKGYDVGVIYPQLENDYKDEALKWIKNNPREFIKLGFIRIKNVFFSGAKDLEEWALGDFKKLHTTIGFERDLRVFRFVSDTIINALSLFGFIYLILNIKKIVMAVFNKKLKLSFMELIPPINLAFFASIFFVYEGQPRYNFPLLFLLVITTIYCLDIINQNLNKSVM